MDIELFGIGSVAAISVICFLVNEAVKVAVLNSKWCPVICGALGGLLGYVGMNVIPNFPVQDWLTAIAVGIVSGWGATGAHQIYKQLFIKKEKEVE